MSQYFAEQHFTAIETVFSLYGPQFFIFFSDSSWQNNSSSVRLDRDCLGRGIVFQELHP